MRPHAVQYLFPEEYAREVRYRIPANSSLAEMDELALMRCKHDPEPFRTVFLHMLACSDRKKIMSALELALTRPVNLYYSFLINDTVGFSYNQPPGSERETFDLLCEIIESERIPDRRFARRILRDTLSNDKCPPDVFARLIPQAGGWVLYKMLSIESPNFATVVRLNNQHREKALPIVTDVLLKDLAGLVLDSVELYDTKMLVHSW